MPISDDDNRWLRAMLESSVGGHVPSFGSVLANAVRLEKHPFGFAPFGDSKREIMLLQSVEDRDASYRALVGMCVHVLLENDCAGLRLISGEANRRERHIYFEVAMRRRMGIVCTGLEPKGTLSAPNLFMQETIFRHFETGYRVTYRGMGVKQRKADRCRRTLIDAWRNK